MRKRHVCQIALKVEVEVSKGIHALLHISLHQMGLCQVLSHQTVLQPIGHYYNQITQTISADYNPWSLNH